MHTPTYTKLTPAMNLVILISIWEVSEYHKVKQIFNIRSGRGHVKKNELMWTRASFTRSI